VGEHYGSEPNGHKPIAFEDTGYVYPHRCWTCMVPCLIREDIVMDEVDGQCGPTAPSPATGPTRWRSGHL